MINIYSKAKNKDIIVRFENIPQYINEIKDGEYCMESNDLIDTILKLNTYDEVKITFEDLNIIKEIPVNNKYFISKNSWKSNPFEHQLDGIEFGKNHNCWLLLDDPGLGKTLQMIYLAKELKLQKNLEHCLIICGINSSKVNWEREILKHSDETVRILGKKINSKGKVSYDTIANRAKELLSPIKEFFIITNIETIRNEQIIKALKKNKNNINMIVVDEIHKCKNSSSDQGHGLLKLVDAEYRIGLTGTLIMNNPLDTYTALKWIGVEHANLTTFKKQYCVYGGISGHEIVGYKNLDILKEELNNCSLRRTKDMLKDLPDKNVITEIIEMNDNHKKFYDAVKKGIKEECDKIDLKAKNVLSLTTRLLQATSCPSVLTNQNIKSSKIERALELIDEIVSNGDKVVVMCTFKDPINEIYNLVNKEYKPLIGTGDIDDQTFNNNIELFQNNPEYKVFLGTVGKAGTSITLNAARYMICINTPWTYAVQKQVEDRIHRVDNKNSVFIYKLVCQGTIDELVDNLLTTKKSISDYVIDDNTSMETLQVLLQYIQDL